jgi:hypothetical protein
MLASHAPCIRASRALLLLLVLAPTGMGNPIPPPMLSAPRPLPCPQPPPAPAPCPPPAPCQSASVQPRIVVNVPPPEIVYQDADPDCRVRCLHPRWSLFNRHCGQQARGGVQTQTVTFAPLQTVTGGSSFTVLGGSGLNFGTANTGVAGLTFANVNPALVPVTPTFVTQMAGGQQVQSAATSGLAAIHQAELYAASVAAGRAQQDAELRVMMAALDRARGSMAASAAMGQAGTASVAGGSAGCPELSCDAVKALFAATTANSKQIGALALKLDTLQQRLDDLTKQVDVLTKQQEVIINRVFPPMVPPKGR